ncbi:MAG: CvpA family protein [Eubacteriales bacterium]
MVFLDIVFLAIFGFAVYKGYKKGVFATLTSIAGYLVGLIGTLVLYKPLQGILGKQLHMAEKLSPWVAKSLSLPVSSQQINGLAMDKAVEIINQRQLPNVFKEIMIQYVRDFSKLPLSKGINTLGEGIAYTISDFLVNSLSFIILFSCLALILRIILPKLFKTVSPRPVTFIDKLGGAVLGSCGGILSIAVLLIVLIPLGSMGALKGNPSVLANQMQNSLVVNLFTNHLQSLLNMIFSGGGF